MNIPFIKHLLTTSKQEQLYEFLTIKQEMSVFLSDWIVRGVPSFLVFNLVVYGVCSVFLYDAFSARALLIFASSIIVFSIAVQIYTHYFKQLITTGAWVHSKFQLVLHFIGFILCVVIFGGQHTSFIYCSTVMTTQSLDLLPRGWWQRSHSINFRLLSASPP
ncbi:MAG: hypothetical protein H6R05_1277 [Burkholderiaceae bacterium]|nr:hypothetical protein [Burkholderiaceae bacterium]